MLVLCLGAIFYGHRGSETLRFSTCLSTSTLEPVLTDHRRPDLFGQPSHVLQPRRPTKPSPCRPDSRVSVPRLAIGGSWTVSDTLYIRTWLNLQRRSDQPHFAGTEWRAPRPRHHPPCIILQGTYNGHTTAMNVESYSRSSANG